MFHTATRKHDSVNDYQFLILEELLQNNFRGQMNFNFQLTCLSFAAPCTKME